MHQSTPAISQAHRSNKQQKGCVASWVINYANNSCLILKRVISMSSYGSSQSDGVQLDEELQDKQPFQYDYFLSKSIDLLLAWNESVRDSQKVQSSLKNMAYLGSEIQHTRAIDKFRTVAVIRTNAFIHVLRTCFNELAKKFEALFRTAAHSKEAELSFYEQRLRAQRKLQKELQQLLAYLQIILDQGLQAYYTNQDNFEHSIFELVSAIYTFVVDPKLIWDILGAEAHLVDSASPHQISLGGNYSYYLNILRNLLKRNLHFRQIYEKIEGELHRQGIEKWEESVFIVKAISLTWALSEESVEEKEKRDFIDCLKGLYFHKIGLQEHGTYYKYIFASLHLEYLQTHRMFKNYSELEEVFISVLTDARSDERLMHFVESLQLNLLPFEKRKHTPKIEELSLDIVENYIGAAKFILGETALFPEVEQKSGSQVYANSKYLFQHQSANGLIDLLMRIQEKSKQAFSLGGLQVHRIYLKMIDLLKRIYLSYENSNWIFPPDILLYIPIHNLIEVSDDIRTQVKRTLFRMVSALGEDQLSRKIVVNQDGELSVQSVSRGEHLQVILLFLDACRREEEYLNLPEVLPRNLETSILYVKSLQARLQLKEPPQDQKGYIIQNLRFCEQEKVRIDFKWFENIEKVEDRVIEFNFEKDLSQDWMRKIYRQAINQRENLKIGTYFEKYQQGKLSLNEMSDLLRYNHGINILQHVNDRPVTIRMDDIFDLLEMIKIPLTVNFDIFKLTLDEEISFNYAHICLGLYNITYKEAEGNEVYRLIMEKIMTPYLRDATSSKSKFKTKYPGFFQKWIYSYQIPELFEELGKLISENGSNAEFTKDAVQKIKMLGEFLDNKESVEKCIGVDQLTTTIIQFSTIMTYDTQPLVYLSIIDLYCMLLKKYIRDSEDISIQFIVSTTILSNQAFIEEALKHVKANETEKENWEPSILNEMLKQLPDYMNAIGFRRTFEIISVYFEIRKPETDDEDCNVKEFMGTMLGKSHESLTFLDFLLQFLIRMRKLSAICKLRGDEEQKQGEGRVRREQHQMLLLIQQSQKVLQEFKEKGECSLQGMSMTDIVFLDDLVRHLNFGRYLCYKELTATARNIFKELLSIVGTKEDLMYFAEKLDMLELILCGGPKEEDLMIALIIENKHKETQTELLKKLLRDNRKLSDAADRAIDILCQHPQKIHSYHVNRLIQINSRYPRERIEQFLIANISCERNNSPAKINQRYLANDLSKLLERIPKKICEELLLKPISGEERDKLIDQVNTIFEKLLYLPLKKFENISLATVEEADDEEWGTESDQEETDTRDKKEKSKEVEKEHSQSSGVDEQNINEDYSVDGSECDSQNDNYYRPDYLDIFTIESRQQELHNYGALMVLREELDVLIQGRYNRIKDCLNGKDGKEVQAKLVNIINILNKISSDFTEQILLKMPEELYLALRNYGLAIELSPEIIAAYKKRMEPSTKKPRWLEQFFSDRAESDDSEVDENEDNDYGEEDDQDYQENYYEDDNDSNYGNNDEDNSEEEMEVVRPPRNKASKKKSAKKNEMMEEPPLLLPTYSKIEEEMSGGELKREEIVKLLEIALYMLLRLPESQVKCRHISSFYQELLETSFGQTFLQSFFTVIRFDETEKNLECYVKGLNKQCGLQQVSMQDAINNVLYLLKEIEQKNQDEKKSNVLFKQSGTLLPIAEEMINKFELPLQNNCLTLLMIYISTNKSKIRSKIASLNFALAGDEINENQKEYKLNRKELVRIIDSICKNRSSNRIWEIIEDTMSLKIKESTKLLECIRGYGACLYRKIVDVSRKIIAAIKQREGHRVESSHHIVSRLVMSCKQEIKQFYYINKETLRQIFEKDNMMPQDCELKQIPKTLLKLKEKLMANKQLMRLGEAMFYFLKMLKEQFYGKIEDKMFGKLIHYPKMLIEAAWYYIFIFARSRNYIWTSPAKTQHFFHKYPHFSSYKFRDLQEIFNLIFYFLNLESFCTDKFKELFIPVMMKSPVSAQQVGLRFKVPKNDENIDCQNILVTRRCSFDMAFYQVTGEAISVEFHEEQGSDHGGLVRELMIGWKGRGVGEQAFFIGKILGISFKQGVPYGGMLDISMFVAITNFVPTLQFFLEIDPEIYRSLSFIRENDPSDLCLRFVVEKIINGQLQQIELVEKGREIELDNSNKQRYLAAYCEKFFHLGRENELKEIQRGFNSVVYAEYAQIFTPQEMLKQIRGEEVIDVKMLIGKAKYQGYSEESPVIKWFWSIVEGFNQDLMNTFIQFVTGSPKITVFNGNFNITIEKVYDINCLPVAHTCFNTLDLPEYSTREILEKKLMTAICEGNNSFGIL